MNTLSQIQDAIRRATTATAASRERGNSRHALIDQRLDALEASVVALDAELAAHQADKKAH